MQKLECGAIVKVKEYSNILTWELALNGCLLEMPSSGSVGSKKI